MSPRGAHPNPATPGAPEAGRRPDDRASLSDAASEDREHQLTMQVFSVSAAMVGVCLTAIGLLRLITAQTEVRTLGDDLVAVDATLFVLCTCLAFWSFKTRRPRTRRTLRWAVDALFLCALALMAATCSVIVYAIL